MSCPPANGVRARPAQCFSGSGVTGCLDSWRSTAVSFFGKVSSAGESLHLGSAFLERRFFRRILSAFCHGGGECSGREAISLRPFQSER